MGRWRRMGAGLVAVAAVAAAGCKSDFNQQLLERELRLQEDQIYHLQDQLADKCARLESVGAENQSLKRQLGVADFPETAGARPRPTPAGPPGGAATRMPPGGVVAPPMLAPPTIEDLPPPPRSAAPVEGPRFGPPTDDAPAFRGNAAAPVLDGVPVLPAEPSLPRSGVNGTGGEQDAGSAAAAPAAVLRLSHEDPGSTATQVAQLVLNIEGSGPVDGDGDGTHDGLVVVVEPRDAEGRLVSTVGSLSIAVYEPLAAATATDPSGEGTCIARWEIPAAEAAAGFRRTSRARGVHVVKPWAAAPPAADHVRVFVRMTTFEGTAVETDGTVPMRQMRGGPVAAPLTARGPRGS